MNCTGKRCIMQHDKVDPATCTAVSYCPEATPPKTNADKIRAMSDFELAEFLVNIVSDAVMDFDVRSIKKTMETTLDWLRSEEDE